MSVFIRQEIIVSYSGNPISIAIIIITSSALLSKAIIDIISVMNIDYRYKRHPTHRARSAKKTIATLIFFPLQKNPETGISIL